MAPLISAPGPVLAPHPTQQPGPPAQETYPGYFDNPNHVGADYSQPYQFTLPSADFNKAVHDFNEDEAVFNQEEYEKRLVIEAELMIALEGLKSSAAYLEKEFKTLSE